MERQFWDRFEQAVDKLWRKAWWLSVGGILMLVGASVMLALHLVQLVAVYKMHSIPKGGNTHSQEYMNK